jgi:hypothetical protein
MLLEYNFVDKPRCSPLSSTGPRALSDEGARSRRVPVARGNIWKLTIEDQIVRGLSQPKEADSVESMIIRIIWETR